MSTVCWVILQVGNRVKHNCSVKLKFHYADFATKSTDTNHESPRHKSHRRLSYLCPRQVHNFVGNLSRTFSLTFPVHCNELNSIRATQTGLSRTCHRLRRKHLDMSRWFVSATFVTLCRRLSPKLHDFMI